MLDSEQLVAAQNDLLDAADGLNALWKKLCDSPVGDRVQIGAIAQGRNELERAARSLDPYIGKALREERNRLTAED